jgi:NADH-quinone oxidoreductase subunit E
MDADGVVSIVEKYKGRRASVISILEELQERDGYLSREALELVAATTGRSLVDVYGVATFYRFFRLKPRGKHLCSVCLGTACHVRGAPRVRDEVEKQLNVSAGETTADGEFTVETVNCLGACALGPMVVVDGHYFSNVSKSRVKEILEQGRAGTAGRPPAGEENLFPLEVRCARCNHSVMDPSHRIEGHPSIRVLATSGAVNAVAHVSAVYGALRMEVGEAFPAGRVLDIFCPHCAAAMTGAGACGDCEARMVPLAVEGGGVLQVCSRLGCGGHFLDLSGVNA